MSDANVLLDRLSDNFEVSEQQQDVLVSSASWQAAPDNHQNEFANAAETQDIRRSVIGLTSVSTFVAQKNFHNFAVPRFASHWGIVCDFGPRARTLFHLLFNVATRKVMFESTLWKPEWSVHRVVEVGKTFYDYPKVVAIGKFFGSFHH